MNVEPSRPLLAQARKKLQQISVDPAAGKYLRAWLLPALFGLLVSMTIRAHSLAPWPTMPRVVGNLAVLVATAMLILLASGRRLFMPRDIVLVLLALAASAIVSVLGSGDVDVSLLRLELYVVIALLATVVYLIYRDAGHLPLEACFLAISVVHLPHLLAAILWIKDYGAPFWQYGLRVADFANVRQYAEFAYFAAVCGTGLVLLSRRFLILSFVLAASGLFGIILTGSRGAALSWMLFVLLACCFCHGRLRAALHGLLVFAFSAGLVWYLDRTALLSSPNIFRRIATHVSGEKSFDSGRLMVWRQSLEQIWERPLFGSGPEGYWLSGCCYRAILHAHNFVLQFLLEFGVVGCALMALLVARTVNRLGGLAGAAKLMGATDRTRVLGCLLASYLAYSLIDQMMYHLLPLLHIALFAGLFAAGLAQAKSVGR